MLLLDLIKVEVSLDFLVGWMGVSDENKNISIFNEVEVEVEIGRRSKQDLSRKCSAWKVFRLRF